MKKITLISLLLLSSSCLFSQVKVNFFLANPHIESGLWAIEVWATVQNSQTWRVGSSNIRVDFTPTPTGSATCHADLTASGANSNLSNNSNYGQMTTTCISGGTAISLNITRLNNCYTMGAGPYRLGTLRFNRIDTTGCITLTIRPTSVVQDSISQLFNPSDWTLTNPGYCIRLDWLTGIDPTAGEVPSVFRLYNNYPNPFNPATTIKYDIPKPADVQLIIFDMLGKEVSRLVNARMEAGRYEAVWDAKNFSSGTYFYKLQTESFTDIKKLVLVK